MSEVMENFQRRALRRNRLIATALLGAVAALMIATIFVPQPGFCLLLVRTTAEAAVVGALADWFAVTALFRHPLGLPIPHTNILQRRRTEIIEGIVRIVEEDWLSPDVIAARLARLTPSELVADWLRDPGHVERLAAPLRDLLRGLARTLDEAEVADFIDRALQRQL